MVFLSMKGVFFLFALTCIVVEAGRRRYQTTTTPRQKYTPATTQTPPKGGSYEHEQLALNIEKELKEINSTLDAIYTLVSSISFRIS
ncbi:hypothetical protein DPMN_176086 [Dreissena polymorpha]|uniref:Uncharacterized protein n=1 Tax=Dreissena polymorpha TaxID=45954 RepID=A0A9D4E7S3_DREPO|nr:hypothetical protein DPMN_176086 [Dreissena polymorpha]